MRLGDFDLDARDFMGSILASRPTPHISLATLGVADTRAAILDAFDREDTSAIRYMGHRGIIAYRPRCERARAPAPSLL